MLFALTGPHQGKTMNLAGFRFTNGVTEVPDEARDAHNLLSLHYATHPLHLLEKDKSGKLIKRATDAEVAPAVFEMPSDAAMGVLEENLAELSRAELRVKASEMGLDVMGGKDDLLARIKEAQAAAGPVSK